MERTDIAYLINSTPKYYYLLNLHLRLLRRYANTCDWPIFIASEEPNHPILKELVDIFAVRILPLKQSESGFLESRAAAIQKLPPHIQYVLPMQEDFLLERYVDIPSIEISLDILDKNSQAASVRWMPCPGPVDRTGVVDKFSLVSEKDTYRYTFQATLWRRADIYLWFSRLIEEFNQEFPTSMPMKDRMFHQIRGNYAENQKGQRFFWEWLGDKKHFAWIRVHKAPNGVYMSPWPYRPTAVTNGRLEEWAIEMAKREGYPLKEIDT